MRRLFALLITTIIIISTGCSQQVSTYRYSYLLVVDPIFTHDELESMLRATRTWQDAVPCHFTWGIAPCNQPDEGQICVKQSPKNLSDILDGQFSQVDGQTNMEGDRDIITMFPSSEAQDELFFEQVMLHELGHSMGLIHHSGCHVMNPWLTECSLTPDGDDVFQWWSIPRQ